MKKLIIYFSPLIIAIALFLPSLGQAHEADDGLSCLALTFSQTIGIGDRTTHNEVSALQTYLKSTGDFTYPTVTGYFGSVTQSAVQKWQASHSVVSAGSPATTGYGVVGPKTRATIRSATCGTTSTPTPTYTAAPVSEVNTNTTLLDDGGVKEEIQRVLSSNSEITQANLEDVVAQFGTDNSKPVQDNYSFSVQSETVSLPHPDDPKRQFEHIKLFELVARSGANIVAAKSGNWSDPSTWQGGVPANGSQVLIPSGLTVTVDTVTTGAPRWVRVDGTLRFATDRDTFLKVETIVVDPAGYFEMGTESSPVNASHMARILFTDSGPIDSNWDPLFLSRGLISHGKTRIYGATLTSFAKVSSPVTAGTSVIHFQIAPAGWKVGGRLIIPGISPEANQDEDVTIAAINGTSVTLNRSLSYNHVPDDNIALPIAYMNRNVILESENKIDASRRAHFMQMHSPNAVLGYAAFEGLGRTDAKRFVTDPQLDEAGHLIAGTGDNPRGRYAVHFHRPGPDKSKPIYVTGIVIDTSPKLGLVNHEGNVIVEDSVTYNVTGSGFFTEAGNEIGAFRRDLAIRSEGSVNSITSRVLSRNVPPPSPLINGGDFGHTGHGFWLEGGGVLLEDDIAIGHRRAGFIFFTVPLTRDIQFPTKNLTDQSIAGGRASIPVGDVPFVFRRGIALASSPGFEAWFHQTDPFKTTISLVEDSTFANLLQRKNFPSGIENAYGASGILYKNVRVIGNPANPQGVGIAGQTFRMLFENLYVVGFEEGIDQGGAAGYSEIKGGYMNNVVNIYAIGKTTSSIRTIVYRDINFDSPNASALRGRTHYDIVLDPNRFVENTPDAWSIFENRKDHGNIITDYGEEFKIIRNGVTQHLIFEKQGRDYVLNNVNLPDQLKGKTNGQLWDEYRLTVGGKVAPANVTREPGIKALLSTEPQLTPPRMHLVSPRFVTNLSNYIPVVEGSRHNRVSGPAVNLEPGWNVVRVPNVEGYERAALVFGGAEPVGAPRVDVRANGSNGPLNVTSGSLVKVTWTTRDAETCTASGDWSGSKTMSGEEMFDSVTSNKTFSLVCSGKGGNGRDNVSVTVGIKPPPKPGSNLNLRANDSEGPVAISVGSQVTLSWGSTGASSCVASGGWTGSKNSSGTETVGPINENTTFTITCSTSEGEVSDNVGVNVVAVGGPTVDVKVNDKDGPISVEEGASDILISWSAQNATSCKSTGSWAHSARPLSGFIQNFDIAVPSTYTITCSDAAGVFKSDTVEVGIVPPQKGTPTVDLMLNATQDNITLSPGDRIHIFWTSSSVDSCEGSGSWKGIKDRSGVQIHTASKSGTYTITCKSGEATVSDSVNVTVESITSYIIKQTAYVIGSSWKNVFSGIKNALGF